MASHLNVLHKLLPYLQVSARNRRARRAKEPMKRRVKRAAEMFKQLKKLIKANNIEKSKLKNNKLVLEYDLEVQKKRDKRAKLRKNRARQKQEKLQHLINTFSPKATNQNSVQISMQSKTSSSSKDISKKKDVQMQNVEKTKIIKK